MDLTAVRALGESLLVEHGLRSWRFTFDNAKRRAGACKFEARTISVSRHLMSLYEQDHVRDTVLHEIAHALVGPTHGHDGVWRARALEIGCSGSRLVAADAPRAPAPWRATCPRGHSYERHRRPARPASCARCDPGFNPDYLLRWTFHGRQVSMGARYEREVLRLLAAGDRRRVAEIFADPRLASALLEDEPVTEQPALWWEREPDADDPRSETEAWVLDDDGRRWRVEEPPPEIEDPPLTPRMQLREAAARGHLTPGWVVRITAQGKYLGAEGTVVKRARTRYHVRRGTDVLTVPFELVEPLHAG